jgi:hypothetical protein
MLSGNDGSYLREESEGDSEFSCACEAPLSVSKFISKAIGGHHMEHRLSPKRMKSHLLRSVRGHQEHMCNLQLICILFLIALSVCPSGFLNDTRISGEIVSLLHTSLRSYHEIQYNKANSGVQQPANQRAGQVCLRHGDNIRTRLILLPRVALRSRSINRTGIINYCLVCSGGIDTCDAINSQVASCLKSAGKTFAITRALHSTGTVDTYVHCCAKGTRG